MSPSTAAGKALPKRRTTFDCTECGMLLEGPAFHPYWHCVLFKNGIDPRHLDPPDPRIIKGAARTPEQDRFLGAIEMTVKATKGPVVCLTQAQVGWLLQQAEARREPLALLRALVREMPPIAQKGQEGFYQAVMEARAYIERLDALPEREGQG